MPPKAKFTRDTIIAAALDIVRAAGMPALTARALSSALNCSVAPIFSSFANMEEVQAEVVEQVKKLYTEYIYRGLTAQIPFKGVGEQYIRFAVEQPNFFKLLFMLGRGVKRANGLLPVIDDNYDVILNSVKVSFGVDGACAEKIYKHLFIYSHGVASLCATGVYTFTGEEVGEMLAEACVGIIKHLKGQYDNG
ncbi:MAG: TetR/AcrR family transcriptional regulator [Clostridiales bacterium]|nr:TetR/AcrR family transcriptional regulator [Clostridiales bacterium]